MEAVPPATLTAVKVPAPFRSRVPSFWVTVERVAPDPGVSVNEPALMIWPPLALPVYVRVVMTALLIDRIPEMTVLAFATKFATVA